MSCVKSKKIKDGLYVHFIKAEKFKTNLISLYITVPYGKDNAEICSLLPKVLKRGCEKYPTINDMAKKREDLYGASFYSGLRKNGDGAGLYFSLEFVSDKFLSEKTFSDAVDFLKNVVLHPNVKDGKFDENCVETEKKNLKDYILGLVNDKKDYADQAVKELAFPNDSYSIPNGGKAENVDKITTKELFDFYCNIVSNCRFDVFLSGSFNEDEAEKIITDEIFSDIDP